jgi:hypothetical protein
MKKAASGLAAFALFGMAAQVMATPPPIYSEEVNAVQLEKLGIGVSSSAETKPISATSLLIVAPKKIGSRVLSLIEIVVADRSSAQKTERRIESRDTEVSCTLFGTETERARIGITYFDAGVPAYWYYYLAVSAVPMKKSANQSPDPTPPSGAGHL